MRGTIFFCLVTFTTSTACSDTFPCIVHRSGMAHKIKHTECLQSITRGGFHKKCSTGALNAKIVCAQHYQGLVGSKDKAEHRSRGWLVSTVDDIHGSVQWCGIYVLYQVHTQCKHSGGCEGVMCTWDCSNNYASFFKLLSECK